MQINYKYLPLVMWLVLGIVFGIAVQKFFPIGSPLSSVVNVTQTPPPTAVTQEEYQQHAETARLAAQIKRSDYQRVVHFYGDSIGRGRGLGEYEMSSSLDRIEDTAQLLLRDNGVSNKQLLFRYAWTQDTGQMAAELKAGMIRDGDIIVYEDAGQHEDDIGKRRQRFLNIEKIVRDSGRKVQLVFTTMFDYQPASGFYNSNYDALVGDSGMTMNQVVVQVAASGSTSLLDWNEQMDSAVVALTPYGISPMLPDGVHPNALGNVLLAASLVKYAGIPITNYQSVKQEFQRLPAKYYVPLGWARPLAANHLDPVLRALFEIANTL